MNINNWHPTDVQRLFHHASGFRHSETQSRLGCPGKRKLSVASAKPIPSIIQNIQSDIMLLTVMPIGMDASSEANTVDALS
jgi:hypothetical protein